MHDFNLVACFYWEALKINNILSLNIETKLSI
jgi:hypothetical protein